jgi:hypothetical protein
METLAIHKLELAHLMLWVTLNEDYPKKPYLNIFASYNFPFFPIFGSKSTKHKIEIIHFLNPGTTRCVAKSCLPKDLT